MAGKPSVWMGGMDERLIALVAETIAKTGRSNWSAIGEALGVSAQAARVRYVNLQASDKAPKVGDLQRQYRDNAPQEPIQRPQQTVEDSTKDGVREVRAHGVRIRTVDDLLRHIEADMTRFEVDRSEATKNEMVTKGDDGAPVVTEYFRVFVRLKPKAGPTTQEQVEAMIAAAFAKRKPLVPKVRRLSGDREVTQEIIASDAHIGKRAWPDETGGPPYDTPIAERLVRESFAELIAKGAERGVGRRAFRILGDWSNHDTPGTTTTAGTVVDSDSRLQKILDVGTELLVAAVEESARTAQTVVMFVPGNHDEVLTWAFQKIIAVYFAKHPRVTVDEGFTSRKYDVWGRTLLGFAHGDKARKKLPGLMSLEAARWWTETCYREIHTGHLHSIAAIETVDGVITRTAPSIAATDGWHAREGYVGALRGMESFYYHRAGALVGMDVSCPDWGRS